MLAKDVQSKFEVFRKAKSLRNVEAFKNVYLNPDRTVTQQQQLKQLQVECKRRRDTGEDVVIYRGEVIGRNEISHFRDRDHLILDQRLYPSIFLCNIQSLQPKYDELCVFSSAFKPAVIAITESWLNDTISDAQIMLPHYASSIRCDREARRGGGVCAYIRTDFQVQEIKFDDDIPECIECVWLYFPSCKLILTTIRMYRQICDLASTSAS